VQARVNGVPASLRRPRRDLVQVVLVGAILLIAVTRLPLTLLSDVRGARDDARLTPTAAAEARGPAASRGTNIQLLRAARARIPSGASFAILRGGRWGTAARPNRSQAFVWESGESWTQYYLAPRIEVAQAQASWLLIRDATPGSAGVRAPLHEWRFGTDWLVEVRR
jgi:hypothetical protein